MTTFTINHISDSKNAGIAREHDLCAYMGIERTKHDSTDYRTSSDICALYKTTVHSDTFCYVTADYEVFMMNITEFEQFVYEFCTTERESEKNGGAIKIRCRKESKKMITWLHAHIDA